MTDTKLPTTEQELNDLISAKVKEATDNLVAKHNGEMAQQRQKFDADLKKAKEQANMSAEELAQQKIKEQQDATDKELEDLRKFKKSTLIGERLQKENLPNYFKNDARLLSAEDGDIDKVIKDIKKDYEASLPKGAKSSTVVQTSTGGKSTTKGATAEEQRDVAYESFGKALNDFIGK